MGGDQESGWSIKDKGNNLRIKNVHHISLLTIIGKKLYLHKSNIISHVNGLISVSSMHTENGLSATYI